MKKLFISLILAANTAPLIAMEQEKSLDVQLLDRAANGIFEEIKTLLSKGASPLCADEFGNTALILAAQDKEEGYCRLLAKHQGLKDRQKCILTFLCCLKQKYHLLYKEQDFFKEHILNLYYRPIAPSTKQVNTLLLCLKRHMQGGNMAAHLLYRHNRWLVRPYVGPDDVFFKPVELLRMKNKEGKTAYDYLPLQWLNPDDEVQNEK